MNPDPGAERSLKTPNGSAAPLPVPSVDLAVCHRYILSRQNGDGGFCFYRDGRYGVEESNAADTYYAVASLHLLHAALPRVDETVEWLCNIQEPSGWYPGVATAWYALEALRLLDARPAHDPRIYLEAQGDRLSAWHGRALEWSSALLLLERLTDLYKHWNISFTAQQRRAIAEWLQALRGERGGYGRPAENLIDTQRAVVVINNIGLAPDERALAFAERCIDPQAGFRLVPQSPASSVEAVQAGVTLFQTYRKALPPVIRDSASRFVSLCQYRQGGFGRVSGALPALTDTWRALDVLHRCDGADRRRAEAG